jgi:hypothetical protein
MFVCLTVFVCLYLFDHVCLIVFISSCLFVCVQVSMGEGHSVVGMGASR